MCEQKTYNGWSNYETWLVNVWFDGDSYLQEIAQDHINKYQSKTESVHIIADAIKEYIEEFEPKVDGFFSDLITAALGEVDYFELAEALLDSCDDPETNDDETATDDEEDDEIDPHPLDE